MLLSDYITKDRVIFPLKSNDKEGALKEIVEKFNELGVIKDKDEFLKKIKEREAIESTGIGQGVAIPHARSETVKKLSVIFGKSNTGVEYDSIDGKPVNLIFMIAAPKEVKKEYLQLIAKIARLLKTNHYRDSLDRAKSINEILQVIVSFDDRFPREMKVYPKNGRVIHQKGE